MTEHDDVVMGTVARAAARMPRTVGAIASGAVLLFDEIGSTNTFAREALADGRLTAGFGASDADETGFGSGKSSVVDGAVDGTGRVRAGGTSDSGRAADVIAVVATDTQTAGRGRLDHTWVSKAGESFTVSFVTCVPRTIATNADVNGWLQMIAGLSARDALRDAVRGCDLIAGTDDGAVPKTDEGRSIKDGACCDDVPDVADGVTASGVGDAARADTGARPGNPSDFRLKWPNDIFCDGRKLGGILAEMVMLPDDPRSVSVVFGVGLNLAVPADRLPTAQATSLQLHYRIDDDDTDRLRDAIAARIVESLRSRLGAFVDKPDDAVTALLKETRDCCWTLGKRVEAHFADGSALRGTALALNPDASLTIRDADGDIHIVHTADVGVLA